MDDIAEQKKELDEPESTDVGDEVKEENSTKTNAKTSNDELSDIVDDDCSKSKDDDKEIKNDSDVITNVEDEKSEEKQLNENDDKSTENKTKNDNSVISAEEKANSETEETDELQLIYKGLTDPSLSSKKIPDKLVESTSSAVSTKNLIEFLEDESDIQVENSSTLKSDDSFLNIRTAEKTTAVDDQPMEVEQEKTNADEKIVPAPTTTVRRIPSLVLTRLDDEIEQFADKPFYEKIKTALKLLKGEKAIVKEQPAIVSKTSTDCDTAIKKEEVNNNSNNDVEFLEKIDVVKVEPVEEENVDFERIAKTNNDSLLDNKENEAVPPVENVPKRRGRKKGVHYSRTPITHDKGYDEDYKMSREPVKFSMQTRKRKLKFLPDGSLVSHKYSPPSSRIDSGDSSGSENDSDAEFNDSSLNEEPPAKRKYVRKSSTIQSSTPVLGIKRGPGRPPKNRSFDFDTYCKNRMSGKPLPYEVEKPLDECFNEDDTSAIKKRYCGAIDPASIMTYLINERITLSRMNSYKFPLVVDKDKRDMQLYKQFTTCYRSSVVRLTTNNNVDGNDSKLQRGHITTSNKSASISYEIMKTRDKLKAVNFDHSRQFGDIIIPKNLDQPVKYGIQIPNGTVIRKSAPGKFGSIVPIEKPKVQSPLPNNSNDNNNNNKSILSSEDHNDNKTSSTKKSGLGQLFRDMAKDADNDDNSPSNKKLNDSLSVSSDQCVNKDSNEKEMEDENSSKMDCENSSEPNFWPLKKDNQQSSVSLPICLNREDIRKKESRTVKTTRGPKKALKQPANDEDDDTYIYNISDADDTMLKLVTEHLQMSAKSRSIYDLMEEITLQMPTWNLHIMPDKSSFCIAQVARGRMGIPILKKSIELDTNFSAKVYVHQLHCKRYDGTYNDEHSLVNLIREIDSLSA